ncbi:MAG: primosomal protein N' [Thermodesulfobacteriota bacterium]
MTIHLEVAVAAPLFQSLTYSCRTDQEPPPVGVRILVPLGRQRVTGYVLGQQPEAKECGYTIRPYLRLLDDQPLFPANMVPFFRWLADYYHFPLGEVIKLALPGGLTLRSRKELALSPEGRASLDPDLLQQQPAADQPISARQQKNLAQLGEAERQLINDLLSKGSLSASASQGLLRSGAKGLIGSWQRQGLVTLEETLTPPAIKVKREWCLAPCHGPRPEKLKKSQSKTLTLLHELSQPGQQGQVPRRDLTKVYKGAGPAIKELASLGLLHLSERELFRDPFGERPPFFAKPETLTAEQEEVLARIKPAVAEGKFSPFLLHGVTGSGKTEVFLRAAETALAKGRSVLVLVPEIALASQIEGHFFSRFGDKIAILHSGMAAGARFDQWRRIARGEAPIVIGARSAIFAPLPDPGLIIVDEEHDPAYKQEDSLRYQARDLAVLRASQQGATAILASATPSVTSFHNAQQDKYKLLTMTKRVGAHPLPQVEIVDLKGVKTVSGRPPLFSPQLMAGLKENLAAGNQSLVFLNRRGFANLLLCADCGETIKCPHCAITLTLHKGKNRLLCHYCDHQAASKPICPSCRSPRIKEMGFGTERLEEELRTALPEARLARLDRDTATKRADFLAILKKMHKQEIDILVGTQMIAKGHHFPHVTLVGLVWADAGLSFPDFKAGERTFQLIAQVTGRAGRGDKAGRVLIQSYQPDHYAVQMARAHDFQGLYEREISLRQTLRYPPFARLINVKFSGLSEEATRACAEQCAAMARSWGQQKELEILGPAPAPIARLRERFRFQLLLKGWHLPSLQALAHHLRHQPPPAVRQDKVRMTLDVDPDTML